MPNLLPTPLSELPDFLPLGEPGSDEELACALGTFTDDAANLDFVRMLARITAERLALEGNERPPEGDDASPL